MTLMLPCNGSEDSETVFVFPASFAQQRLWFLNQLAPDNPFYNVSIGIRLRGRLNLEALEQAFNEIVRRHEVLRTSFAVQEGLAQIVVPNLALAMSVVTLQQGDEAMLALEEARRPFDLAIAPLLRLKLLKRNDTEALLLLTLHHIVSDGWSMGILIRELSSLYKTFDAGEPSPLPDLPLQYADFAVWQQQWLQGEVLESQLAYWRSQLHDLPTLNFPSDRPRLAIETHRGATVSFELTSGLTLALEALSRRHNASLFMTLLAAFQTLLHRYTGERDIAVGSPIANRNRSELEGLIGFFVNSLVLRTDLSGNPTFCELLNRVRQVTLAAYAHQDLPFEKVVQALHPQRDLSRHPLFQVAIALQNAPIDSLTLPNLTLEPYEVMSGTARLDLEVQFWRSPNTNHPKLVGRVTYSTDLFEQTTLDRLIHHFQVLLEGIVRTPDQRLADLPLLTAAEHQRLWNSPEAQPIHHVCIHHLFELQVRQTPHATAAVFEDTRLSYQQLNERSNQLAQYLRNCGVTAESLVAVCLDRSLDMLIAVLGILKAGGAYVPLDPAYPQARLDFILNDTQAALLVTQHQWRDRFTPSNLRVVCLNCDAQAIAEQSQDDRVQRGEATDLAYVIYTSGSTGTPKGVLIEHRGLCNLAEAQRQFGLQPADRVLQFASLSFDASIFEIVMAWQAGATLYLLPPLSGTELIQVLRHQAITVATLPPAVLKLLPAANLPALKTVISAGEACSADIVDRWLGDRRFFNAYGLTETTVWATVAEICDRGTPSLGWAIANTQCYVLDAQLQPVPVGVVGELYLSGVGLARGYLNRPDLTAERFIPHPFSSLPQSRLYKTGDRVREQGDRQLEFLGRMDDQVKLRGYRVELGEIEAVLAQHPAVRQVCVICHAGKAEPRLIAYVVSKDLSGLRHFLQQRLPHYLVPSFRSVESLPLTLNGKVDRAALHDLEPVRLPQARSPRTAAEASLVTIWMRLLDLEQVDTEANFFEQGGDSLKAIELMQQIQQEFGQKLPLSALFMAPTIAELAELLKAGSSQPSLAGSPLVVLQSAGADRPFFWVHPVFGVVFPYAELARHLGTSQPFYGLQPQGLSVGQSPFTCIEDMAAHYIEAIQSVQPQGSYRLGGWSFGSLVAFEMAQQLRRSGHQVELLALMDTLAPLPNTLSLCQAANLLTTIVRSALPLVWQFVSLRLLDQLTLRSMLRVFYANSRAAARYVPKAYSGKITLLRTAQSFGKSDLNSALGWEKLGAVKVHTVPGNHITMLAAPQVQVLAALLRSLLSEE